MEKMLTKLENIRIPVMKEWLMQVLPGNKNPVGEFSENLRFENPLYFHVCLEYQKLVDYMRSQDISLKTPVAETLVKFKTLNTVSPKDVIYYPVILRDCIIAVADQNELTFSPEEKLYLDQKTSELLTASWNFYKKTKENLRQLKTKELKQGLFSEASLGSAKAVCPSSIFGENP